MNISNVYNDSNFFFLIRYVLLPSILRLHLSNNVIEWFTPVFYYITRIYRKYLRKTNINIIDGTKLNSNSTPVYYFFNQLDSPISSKSMIIPTKDYWLLENLPIYPHLLLYLMLDNFLHSKKIKHYFGKYNTTTLSKKQWVAKLTKIKKKCYTLLLTQFNPSILHDMFGINNLFIIFHTYEKFNAFHK